jgi:tyrosyl-tRNA synthetase
MVDPSASLLDDLSWRGLLHDSTDLTMLREHLSTGARRFYIGFDPSASSLTIGNLLPVSLIIRGANAGLQPFVLLGGGTGLIGDPSGKSTERTLLPVDEAGQNVARHRSLLAEIFGRALDAERMPVFVDNADWLAPLSAIEFLRDVGRHFPIAEMLRRDSVRRRLDDPEAGISYTEFSYALLQAYDYLRLCDEHDVTLQMGASDQWGNIVAGIDLIRRVLRRQAHGLTCPLLLRPDGTKYGKTEQGAVWISADRTSPYTLYQFLINLPDADAHRFARYFSFSPREELETLFARHEDVPSERLLQRHIARELTTLLHGQGSCEKAEEASRALFSGDVRAISPDMLGDVFADVPTVQLSRRELEDDGFDAAELLIAVGLATSRRDAREHLGNRAVRINDRESGLDSVVKADDLLHGSVVLIRRGKRQWRVARFA